MSSQDYRVCHGRVPGMKTYAARSKLMVVLNPSVAVNLTVIKLISWHIFLNQTKLTSGKN